MTAYSQHAQQKLNTLIASVAGKNMGHWKAFLEVMGFDMGYTELPALAPDAADMAKYEKVLREL